MITIPLSLLQDYSNSRSDFKTAGLLHLENASSDVIESDLTSCSRDCSSLHPNFAPTCNCEYTCVDLPSLIKLAMALLFTRISADSFLSLLSFYTKFAILHLLEILLTEL